MPTAPGIQNFVPFAHVDSTLMITYSHVSN